MNASTIDRFEPCFPWLDATAALLGVADWSAIHCATEMPAGTQKSIAEPARLGPSPAYRESPPRSARSASPAPCLTLKQWKSFPGFSASRLMSLTLPGR